MSADTSDTSAIGTDAEGVVDAAEDATEDTDTVQKGKGIKLEAGSLVSSAKRYSPDFTQLPGNLCIQVFQFIHNMS